MIDDLFLYEMSEEDKIINPNEKKELTKEDELDYKVRNELYDEGIYDLFTDSLEEAKQFQDYDMFDEY